MGTHVKFNTASNDICKGCSHKGLGIKKRKYHTKMRGNALSIYAASNDTCIH